MPKILIIGDIVGKPGRRGLSQVLPMWRKEYLPDLVVANVENLTHGKGVAPKTLAELDLLGIDAYTSGNHVMDQHELSNQCFTERRNLIRPANYMGAWSGKGWCRVGAKNKELRIKNKDGGNMSLRGDAALGGDEAIQSNKAAGLPHSHPPAGGLVRNDGEINFLIINLNGKVFFNEEKFGGIKNPFVTADEIIANVAKEDDIILVDFHAEATSEKAALGWHLDGRASFVYGTHQHVPTADQRILPNGTGFVTDIGMTGPLNSVIGADKEIALASYLDPSKKFKMEVPKEGPVVVRAMLLEIGEDKKIQNITRLEKILD